MARFSILMFVFTLIFDMFLSIAESMYLTLLIEHSISYVTQPSLTVIFTIFYYPFSSSIITINFCTIYSCFEANIKWYNYNSFNLY